MKFKTIVRSTSDYSRQSSDHLQPMFRNPDPLLHPFEREREYKRALNATKLDKLFAKPFVGALSGHTDSVYSLAVDKMNLKCCVSGAFDGEIRVWSLVNRETKWSIAKAHQGIVRGVSVRTGDRDGSGNNNGSFLSCGDDRTVKLWSLPFDQSEQYEDQTKLTATTTTTTTTTTTAAATAATWQRPVRVWNAAVAFTSVDAQPHTNGFATGGSQVDLWDVDRAEATRTYTWGTDTVMCVRFNPVERHLLASTATDRSVALYDLRGDVPVRKLIMAGRSNALCWNPMEPFNFAVANEDHNLYTFDLRKLKRALTVHRDHVYAVLDVDFSPTGRELVSGSYDRTIRIFPSFGPAAGHSRAVYHTKRMQRVFAVRFTMDSRFVLSASDDANVRLWKANASQAIRPAPHRERRALEYQEKLKHRFRHVPELARIRRHQHVPKAIYNAAQRKREMIQSEKRRLSNVIAHSSKKNRPSRVPLRQASIVAEAE